MDKRWEMSRHVRSKWRRVLQQRGDKGEKDRKQMQSDANRHKR